MLAYEAVISSLTMSKGMKMYASYLACRKRAIMSELSTLVEQYIKSVASNGTDMAFSRNTPIKRFQSKAIPLLCHGRPQLNPGVIPSKIRHA